MRGTGGAELPALARAVRGHGSGALLREHRGDRSHHLPRLEEPIGQHGAARAGQPSRPHPRHDLRARSERRHHLLEPRGRGALRLDPGRGDRTGLSPTHENRLPGAARRRSRRSCSAPVVGKGSSFTPSEMGRASPWRAGGPCSRTSGDGPSVRWRPTTTSRNASRPTPSCSRASDDTATSSRPPAYRSGKKISRRSRQPSTISRRAACGISRSIWRRTRNSSGKPSRW